MLPWKRRRPPLAWWRIQRLLPRRRSLRPCLQRPRCRLRPRRLYLLLLLPLRLDLGSVTKSASSSSRFRAALVGAIVPLLRRPSPREAPVALLAPWDRNGVDFKVILEDKIAVREDFSNGRRPDNQVLDLVGNPPALKPRQRRDPAFRLTVPR